MASANPLKTREFSAGRTAVGPPVSRYYEILAVELGSPILGSAQVSPASGRHRKPYCTALP